MNVLTKERVVQARIEAEERVLQAQVVVDERMNQIQIEVAERMAKRAEEFKLFMESFRKGNPS